MAVPTHTIKNFTHGQIDRIEAQSIPDGAASSSKNWLTKGDRIELRRGYKVLGTKVSGTDRVTGLRVGSRADGTQVLFWTYLRKLVFFDEGAATPTSVEVGSDLLPSDANDKDQSLANYHTLAGAQLWINSPEGSLFKIMLNGGRSDIVSPAGKDNFDTALNFKGRIKIKLNRMFLWAREDDPTSIRLSFIDTQNTTAVANEVIGTGDGSTKTFSNTLTDITGKRTAYGITVTDGVETFSDDNNGTLTGDAGGTGTINYSTGAISVTFNANVANSQDVTADYNWEDSTDDGIADFGESATRVAGEGALFLQADGGGAAQSVESFKQVEYCFHRVKTWELTLGVDDTTASNLIYRRFSGIPNHRASVATGQGIYFIDDTNQSKPIARLMRFSEGSTEVIPVAISDNIKLENFKFDKCAAIRWEEYVIFFCRTPDSTINDRALLYNTIWNAWDITDYFGTEADIYNGALVAGDSLSPNALELFSGFDDDDNLIDNNWTSNLSTLGTEELKKTKELWIRGEIQPDQDLDVYLSIDNNPFIFVGTVVGDADYVDLGQAVTIGATVIGKNEVGGGSSGETASPYFRRIGIRGLLDKFERIKVRFIATGIGYVSVSEINHQDIHRHGHRIPPKYDV